jgi:bacterioferritin-associated ferredoxin
MYVCICYGVTENEIADVIGTGATDEEDIAARCRAGSGCGSCLDKIACLIRESRPDHGKLALATGFNRRAACGAIQTSSSD